MAYSTTLLLCNVNILRVLEECNKSCTRHELGEKEMKRILIILVALTSIAINTTIAQNENNQLPAPTTEEEYNYLTKGYKIQVDNGLDMKKGYSFVNMGPKSGFSLSFTESFGLKTTIVTRTIKFKGLVRDGEEKVCAILCICEREDTGFKQYICIPSYNASTQMWENTQNDMNKLTSEWKKVMIYALSQLNALQVENF